MSRLAPADARRAGVLTRLLLRLARRKTRQLTGRETERMIEPLEAYALAPRLLLGYGMLELATAKLARVPERLKVLAELKAATMTSCEYCVDIASSIARRKGIGDEQLLALPRYRDGDTFSELEKLVLDYAVGLSSTPVDVPDALFERLQREFDSSQLVELTNVIALENMRGRFNLAFGIGSAGFSEGMVCALPEHHALEDPPATRQEAPTGGAGTRDRRSQPAAVRGA